MRKKFKSKKKLSGRTSTNMIYAQTMGFSLERFEGIKFSTCSRLITGLMMSRIQTLSMKSRRTRIKNQAGLPPIPEKNKRKVKSHVNHGIFFNGVQLLKPKIAASEKEAIMSKQRFNDAKRKAWSQNDTGHNFITEENIQLLRYKSGKLSKPIKPVKYGGKDYNKPLGHKELIKFRDQIREHHHIDIQDVITKDLKLK